MKTSLFTFIEDFSPAKAGIRMTATFSRSPFMF